MYIKNRTIHLLINSKTSEQPARFLTSLPVTFPHQVEGDRPNRLIDAAGTLQNRLCLTELALHSVLNCTTAWKNQARQRLPCRLVLSRVRDRRKKIVFLFPPTLRATHPTP